MHKSNKKRTLSQYLSAAKKNKNLVPSLTKYRKRKTLNRWEKAAITRAEKKIAKAARGGTLFALSKSQTKKLKDKEALVGNGIRAVRMRGATGGKVTVEKGRLILKRAGRKWHFEEFGISELNALFARVSELFEIADRSNRELFITIWTAAGRLPETKVEEQEALAFIANFIEQYRSLDPDFEEWFLGIAYFFQ